MNQMIPFIFDEKPGRTVMIGDSPWWVGKDVCLVLGYTNPNKAMNDHCDGVTERYPIADSLGRKQEVRVISEGDVFRLIISSRLPEAQRFENWLFEEVLPQIRKTGGYGPELDNLRTENKALRKLVRRCETRRVLTMEDKHELVTMYFRDYTLDQMRRITTKSVRLIAHFLFSYLRDEAVQDEPRSFIEAREKAAVFNGAAEAGSSMPAWAGRRRYD